MISQKCPRCHSSRVRRGYRPTRFWSKIFFRYNLLCNACNWQFKGFAVPGTVTVKPARKSKKNAQAEKEEESHNNENSAGEKAMANLETEAQNQFEESARAVSSDRIRIRKKIRIRQS